MSIFVMWIYGVIHMRHLIVRTFMCSIHRNSWANMRKRVKELSSSTMRVSDLEKSKMSELMASSFKEFELISRLTGLDLVTSSKQKYSPVKARKRTERSVDLPI